MVAANITDSLQNSVSMPEAAGILGCHVNSVFRMATRGVRKVKLETFLKAGKRVTTRDAIERFLLALNAGPAAVATEISDAERRGVEAGRALESLNC